MGVLKLNDIEYSGGSSANIDITTTLTEDTVSDTSVPSSKAVYDELQKVDANTLEGLTAKELTANSVKNLIPYPYYNSTITTNGITYTDNGDGTITANGTATARADFCCLLWNNYPENWIKAGTYTLSSDRDDETVSMHLSLEAWSKSDKTYIKNLGNTNQSGNKYIITITEEDVVNYYITPIYYINTGITVDNYVFKPMLEMGSIAHDYVQYNKGGVVNNQIEILENGDETLPRTIVTTTNNGTSYLVNRDENDVRRQIKIEPVETNSDVNSALKYETSESGEWVSNTIIHSGNIADYICSTSANLYGGTATDWALDKYITVDVTDDIQKQINEGFPQFIRFQFGSGSQAVGVASGNTSVTSILVGIDTWVNGIPIIEGKTAYIKKEDNKIYIWCDENPSLALRNVLLAKNV